jgi:hypothetical protein
MKENGWLAIAYGFISTLPGTIEAIDYKNLTTCEDCQAAQASRSFKKLYLGMYNHYHCFVNGEC